MQLREGEIAPGKKPVINKVEKAQKTWFFERPDGTTFACQQNEAWQILQKGNAYHRGLKLIGCSNGEIFRNAVAESHKVYAKTKSMAKARKVILEGEKAELAAARGNMELPANPETVRFE